MLLTHGITKWSLIYQRPLADDIPFMLKEG
jgi:hypothetical protein